MNRRYLLCFLCVVPDYRTGKCKNSSDSLACIGEFGVLIEVNGKSRLPALQRIEESCQRCHLPGRDIAIFCRQNCIEDMGKYFFVARSSGGGNEMADHLLTT